MTNYVTTTVDARGVATVNMTRSEVHNAFDDVMIAQLISAFEQLKNDDNVRAVVLRSTGK
ncbi:MAG: gamma-carboxygeranoyl-CoA hydratase, partial [Gammaproteobacteria bacterium]|nr:gamma-carboxygeranoyl-CoA hydratase [Gammaproteobacteria bacterium]